MGSVIMMATLLVLVNSDVSADETAEVLRRPRYLEQTPVYLPPAAPWGADDKIAVEIPANARRAVVELRIVERDIRSGKTAEIAKPRVTTIVGTPGSIGAVNERAAPIPPGLGSVGVQFEEFGLRVNYVVLELTEIRTDLLIHHVVTVDLEYQSLDEGRRPPILVRVRRKLEAGRQFDVRMPKDKNVDYLIEMKIRPAN
jgi:hypothetical protein